MKKRVLWFDFVQRTLASDVFEYLICVCIRQSVPFKVISDGAIKGRLEFECDDALWGKMCQICFQYYKYVLTDEEL